MKLALATANPGKIKEMINILAEQGVEVITRESLGIDFEVEETGTTFSENARIKAAAIYNASKMPSIADDSGLAVDALGGEPGVYTSSFGGDELSATERCNYLLKKMEKVEDIEQRRAKFVCTIVCAFPDGELIEASGECPGYIAFAPAGSGGFGYDPVFIPEGFDKTMAQLTSDEKNAISYRGEALRNFSRLLASYKAGNNL